MCVPNFIGHKVLVCTVGDLKPGQRYRTPDGRTMMVTDYANIPGHVSTPRRLVVNIHNGRSETEDPTIKLGTDQRGRLYASRSLNPVQPDAVIPGGYADQQAADDGPYGRIE